MSETALWHVNMNDDIVCLVVYTQCITSKLPNNRNIQNHILSRIQRIGEVPTSDCSPALGRLMCLLLLLLQDRSRTMIRHVCHPNWCLQPIFVNNCLQQSPPANREVLRLVPFCMHWWNYVCSRRACITGPCVAQGHALRHFTISLMTSY